MARDAIDPEAGQGDGEPSAREPGPDSEVSLSYALVNDDDVVQCMVFPVGTDPDESRAEWMVADDGAFVNLDTMR